MPLTLNMPSEGGDWRPIQNNLRTCRPLLQTYLYPSSMAEIDDQERMSKTTNGRAPMDTPNRMVNNFPDVHRKPQRQGIEQDHPILSDVREAGHWHQPSTDECMLNLVRNMEGCSLESNRYTLSSHPICSY